MAKSSLSSPSSRRATERKSRREAGYSQEVFEEDWLPKRVWLAPLPSYEPPVVDPAILEEDTKPMALEIDGSVFHVRFSPDGRRLAVDVAPTAADRRRATCFES